MGSECGRVDPGRTPWECVGKQATPLVLGWPDDLKSMGHEFSCLALGSQDSGLVGASRHNLCMSRGSSVHA